MKKAKDIQDTETEANNANMHALNKELLSANEELRALNLRLVSLNAGYQSKNRELLEVNDDLNNYFRNNVNGQIFVNYELLVIRFSISVTKLFKLTDSDIGRYLGHIPTYIKFETIIDDAKKVIADGGIITKEIETNDGKWYQVVTIPFVKRADNSVAGAIITFNDITELEKAQLELRKKNQSLMRINADLDNFIYAVSHDLLSPLNNIEQSITIMMSEIKVADPDLKKLLDIINSSIQKFHMLVVDMAAIGQLENDMIVMQMVDVGEILDDIEWSLEDKIKLSGAAITRKLEVKKILFSKKNLRSILFNLISNSIKFRRDESPQISVHTIKEGDNVILTVEDNGIGISKSSINKIFEMYGRLHQDVEGHGIGLFLAKKIIDAAGGNIVIDSEPGKGSKFIISIKAVPENVMIGVG